MAAAAPAPTLRSKGKRRPPKGRVAVGVRGVLVLFGRDSAALSRIEAVVHPLVREDRARFSENHPDTICVFDIPLLFETGSETEMDAVACVNIPPDLQRSRVLARGTMNAEDLDRILARQMPNAEKCARSDFVIETDTIEHARAQVRAVLEDIERRRHA